MDLAQNDEMVLLTLIEFKYILMHIEKIYTKKLEDFRNTVDDLCKWMKEIMQKQSQLDLLNNCKIEIENENEMINGISEEKKN